MLPMRPRVVSVNETMRRVPRLNLWYAQDKNSNCAVSRIDIAVDVRV